MATDALSMWGAEQRILDTSQRLSGEGFEVTLAAPSSGPLPVAWRDAGMPYVAFDVGARTGLRLAGSDRRPGAAELAGQLRATWRHARMLAGLARGHDVIHSHSLVTNLEVAVAARLVGVRAVLDVHDIVRPGLGRKVLTAGAALADATIANSGATAATVGWPAAGKVTVIYPGVDVERFRPGPPDPGVRPRLAAHPGGPVVGIVGRVDPDKGIEVLVRAASALGQDGLALCVAVVGAPTASHRDFAEALREEAGRLLGERVRFLGAVSDVERVIRGLDVVVNASWAEPFGRSVLEAQASGVPVIATSAGGIVDFVADGVTGLLVPPGDEQALAAALRRLLGSPALGRRLAGAARDQAIGRYSAEAHSGAVGRVWQGLTDREPGSGPRSGRPRA